MLTVKKSNHKIRSRDLLLSLMCYAFMCSGCENYSWNRKCQNCLHNLSHGCCCRRFDSSTILRLSTHMYRGRTTTLRTFIRDLSLLISHARAQGVTTPQQAFVINGTCEEMQQRFSETLVNNDIWNSIKLKICS